MQQDPETKTGLALGIARLRSIHAIECLSALLAVAAIVGATLAPSGDITRILLASSLLAASLVAYASIRVRIDIALFERWESLDSAALDQALLALNPNFAAGRSLQSRIDGSLAWWRRGLGSCAMQLALCVAAVVLGG